MIVLSRKIRDHGTPEGRIYVGDDIVLHVHSTKEGQVRIGISAPGDVKIWRGELLSEDVRQAIEKAAGFSPAEHQHDLGGEA